MGEALRSMWFLAGFLMGAGVGTGVTAVIMAAAL